MSMWRILFFGMAGLFSKIPLARLLAQPQMEVVGVILPAVDQKSVSQPRRLAPPQASASDLPLLNPHMNESIVHLAWQHQIPVWEVSGLKGPATHHLIEQLQPDVICVVCFPYLLPPALLTVPKFGCLNLHPSLLPAYRGPTPLFWQMRHAQKRGGVTLHFLGEGIDSGDIVAQRAFDLPEGITEQALTELCAVNGAELLLETLSQPEPHPLPAISQPITGASYFATPTDADLIITTDWSAQRAFNFLRGANSWPLSIQVGGFYVPVAAALSYDLDQTLATPYIQFQDQVLIQFNPGILKIRRVSENLA